MAAELPFSRFLFVKQMFGNYSHAEFNSRGKSLLISCIIAQIVSAVLQLISLHWLTMISNLVTAALISLPLIEKPFLEPVKKLFIDLVINALLAVYWLVSSLLMFLEIPLPFLIISAIILAVFNIALLLSSFFLFKARQMERAGGNV